MADLVLRSRRPLCTALVLATAFSCKVEVDPEAEAQPGVAAAAVAQPRRVDTPQAASADGRVPAEPKLADEQAGPAPGSGKPDETNGRCRLFAPQLPQPECCPMEYGFDAAFVAEQCGFGLYLGESMQGTCGYYFHREGQPAGWMRLSFVPEKTVEAAAKGHDLKLHDVTGNTSLASTPVPGAPGAMWSSHEGYSWAFIPGWDHVRQLSWRTDSCPPDAVARIMVALQQAKQPASGTPRSGLVPVARH